MKSNKAEQGRYGFHYFDKPNQGTEETEDEEDEGHEDEFDLQSCAGDCCDLDCECDDCMRCSNNGVKSEYEEYAQYPAAAA